MKNLVKTILVVVFLVSVVSVNAQQRKHKKGCYQLTESQREELKNTRLEFAESTKDLRNEMNEIKAKQRTLMSAEKLDKRAVLANIEKMNGLQEKLQIAKMKMKLELKTKVATAKQEAQLAKVENTEAPKCKKNQKCGNKATACKRGDKAHGKRGHQHKGHKAHGEKSKMHGKHGRKNNVMASLNLTDEQKQKMRALRQSMRKESKKQHDELQILQLKQRQLMKDEKPSISDLERNIKQQSKLKLELAKQRLNGKIEMRKLLNSEQLKQFVSQPQRACHR